MKKRRPVVFRLLKKNPNPATQGRHYALTYRIPSTDQIFDARANKARVIRYAIGEQSLYQDEQKNDKPVIGDIIFTNGSIIVDPRETLLLEFLEKSNYCSSNENRMPNVNPLYERVDNQKKSEEIVNTIEMEHAAVDAVIKMRPQELIAYCAAAGINSDRTMYEIKHDVLSIAKSNPGAFLETLGNPDTGLNQLIADALKFKLIYMDEAKREFGFQHGNQKDMFVAVPAGQDMKEFLGGWLLSDEGVEVHEGIKEALDEAING